MSECANKPISYLTLGLIKWKTKQKNTNKKDFEIFELSVGNVPVLYYIHSYSLDGWVAEKNEEKKNYKLHLKTKLYNILAWNEKRLTKDNLYKKKKSFKIIHLLLYKIVSNDLIFR